MNMEHVGKKVLVVGSGGREHTLVWALRNSPQVRQVLCAPGNSGIANLAECVPLPVHDYEGIARYAVEQAVDLVVIGPDDPLAGGIVDVLKAQGLRVFGPDRKAAEIEGSKVFMKHLLHKYKIPTATYAAFDNFTEASAYVHQHMLPVVIKADGLAAGKGVVIAHTHEEAIQVLHDVMVVGKFGSSGSKVVIEEFMLGEEMSILAFVDGETVRVCEPAQDHKPIFDGDHGPNTGGMGTYSPLPQFSPSILEKARRTIIEPAAKAMVAEGRSFHGLLFAGLMITPDGEPKVIEFNARFGDPETQSVLPRLKSDLFEVLWAVAEGSLQEIELEWHDHAAMCVIVAAEGYPGDVRRGDVITGLEQAAESALLFHAGTMCDEDGTWRTAGGRVLGVVGIGNNVAAAKAKAYEAVQRIQFSGMQYRSDIGAKSERIQVQTK